MTKEELFSIQIKEPDQEIAKAVKTQWDSIAKPLDGLGKFETIFVKLGAIQGKKEISLKKRAAIVMCADNGVVEEKISQSTKEVTAIVSANMGKGITSVCRMAKVAGADVIPVDIGIDGNEDIIGILHKKAAMGTRNFAKEPAMTETEALQAIETGICLVKECKENGYDLLATGEMGIGNTTTSCAVAAALFGCEVKEIVGKGAGLDDAGLLRKTSVIKEAIKRYDLLEKDAFTVLCHVGGLDIAGLAGVFIGGAMYHMPIVIDGVISAVAGLAAERMLPGCREYMIASHMSREKTMEKIVAELELQPVLYANMALGEGTGAVMLFPLLDQVMAVYADNTTFEDIKIDQYERFEKKEGQL